MASSRESAVAPRKLKAAIEFLDERPVFDPVTFDLLRWAADYYHHPLGEVFAAALPAAFATVNPLWRRRNWGPHFGGSAGIEEPQSRRAPKQRALLAWLEVRGTATAGQIGEAFDLAQLRALAARGWVERRIADGTETMAVAAVFQEIELNAAQMQAVDGIRGSLATFAVHLLYGVTGSGKTEVYLR